ncbi:hypothetical protein [Acinetobacter rudis]|uniref:hypothetical protein n=1 Tax=Acinetobacter rudis TaxID=632955 RepID=UPI0033401FD0
MNSPLLSYQQFDEYNYALYDQYLFRNLLSIYDEQKVKYKILLIDVFGKAQDAPIVVDLKSMNEEMKQDFYEHIYLQEMSHYINFFDNMLLVQNLIQSDLSLDEFSNKMSKLMLIEDKYIFRFFDPRIMIHVFLLNYNQYDLNNTTLKQWMTQHQSTFKVWDIYIWNNRYSLTQDNFSKFNHPKLKSTIAIQHFDQCNKKIKEMILSKEIETVSDIIKNMQKLNQQQEVAYV